MKHANFRLKQKFCSTLTYSWRLCCRGICGGVDKIFGGDNVDRTFRGVAGGLVADALAFDSVLLGGEGKADLVGAY